MGTKKENVNKVILASVISVLSLSSFARSITETDSALESAEKQITSKVRQENTLYKIIEASTNNRIHITAKLYQIDLK